MNELRVFISHARDDGDWVRQFAEALRDQHIQVWSDAEQGATDHASLEAVEAGLRGSDAIVFLLTQAGARNPNVLIELGATMITGKHFIPIIPADFDRSTVPINFDKRPYFIKGTPDVAAREVAEAVKGRAA
jgi:hypothetical protein